MWMNERWKGQILLNRVCDLLCVRQAFCLGAQRLCALDCTQSVFRATDSMTDPGLLLRRGVIVEKLVML